MGNYSMPGYFQAMPVLKGSHYHDDVNNVNELKQIESEIHAQAAKMLAAGVPDEKIHKKGQMTAMERVLALVDEGSFCPGFPLREGMLFVLHPGAALPGWKEGEKALFGPGMMFLVTADGVEQLSKVPNHIITVTQ